MTKLMQGIGLGVSLLLLSACKTPNTKPEACYVKPDAGQCKGAFQHAFFNPETAQCEVFLWGGCGGQVPFKTLEQCKAKCE